MTSRRALPPSLLLALLLVPGAGLADDKPAPEAATTSPDEAAAKGSKSGSKSGSRRSSGSRKGSKNSSSSRKGSKSSTPKRSSSSRSSSSAPSSSSDAPRATPPAEAAAPAQQVGPIPPQVPGAPTPRAATPSRSAPPVRTPPRAAMPRAAAPSAAQPRSGAAGTSGPPRGPATQGAVSGPGARALPTGAAASSAPTPSRAAPAARGPAASHAGGRLEVPARTRAAATGDGHRLPLATIDSDAHRARLSEWHGPTPSLSRPFSARSDAPARMGDARRPYRIDDHRLGRPHIDHVQPHPDAGAPPPHVDHYRGWYGHWYVHPYYRHWHATSCVVGFGFAVYPWRPIWVPPPRVGWYWIPGWWTMGIWWPGYWAPSTTTVVIYDTQYVYVPGYWSGPVYVDGYYRVSERDDGDWQWVEGYYLDDGTWIPGHWRPSGDAPEGYTWEPGFFDGEQWNGGFWRPEFRKGFVWISSWFDSDSVYHAGYWEPAEPRTGFVWVPGWFDGTAWVPGEWVGEAEYAAATPKDWVPEPGWDAGWEDEAPAWSVDSVEAGAPLAIPVTPELSGEGEGDDDDE